MSGLKVLSIASEIFPLIKTGGLADVAGALPLALAREGFTTRTLAPGYPGLLAKLDSTERVHSYNSLMGGPARVLAAKAGALDLFVLDAPHPFARPGGPYAGPDGADWPDNAIRFGAFCRVGADIAKGAVASFSPDILHAHDWQAGLAAAYLHYDGGPRPGTAITIHNLAFQGVFSSLLLEELGLPPEAMATEGVEYFGGIGFLKAGLYFSDRITTVSPTYAREIVTPEGGVALDGLLRSRGADLVGIRNGIDDDVWNPATDELLAQAFDATHLAQRPANKAALQKRFDLDIDGDAPLFGLVTRMTAQKGIDLLLECLPLLLAEGGQVALLGSGERALQDGFAAAALAHPGRVGCAFTYDESLAHLIQGGADFIVIPSRFEPCGLTQLCALRYGSTPIVARVGGLADTIIDANDAALAAQVATGVQFAPPDADQLAAALRRAIAISCAPPVMERMRLNGMNSDVSWRIPARQFASLYKGLASERAAVAVQA